MLIQHNSGRLVAVIGILAATLAASKLAERRIPESLARPLSAIPNEIDGWTSIADPPLSEGVISVLKPTSYVSRTYRKDDQTIGLFIAYYAQQRAGESMHSPKHCLPGAGWEVWDYSSVNIPIEGGAAKINKYNIRNAGSRAVVLYWYQSKRRIVASEYLGKILLIRDALFDGRTAGSIVRITCTDSPPSIAAAVKFAADVVPHLQTSFVN